MEYSLGYREVIPDQTSPDKWKEIIMSTGGSQSTLQDIKVPERAGGYCYKDSSKCLTRNRFIYWRIVHDALELIEHSLDVNLANNRVRYRFTDTPILDGISIHETANLVIILVVTVSSIHKLRFSHPDKMYNEDQLVESQVNISVQSIFSEVSTQNIRDPHTFHLIPNTDSINYPVAHAAASWLIMPEEALFALSYISGVILLLRLDTVTGLVHSSELKHESIVPRFLSGIATALRGRTVEIEVAVSLIIHTYAKDEYLFALCREGYLRVWSCNRALCVTLVDVAANTRISGQNIQNHGLKKMVDSNEELYLCTYLKFNTGGEFCILKVFQDSGIFKLIQVCTLLAPDQHLLDFSFTRTRLWTVWRTSDTDGNAVAYSRLSLENIEVHSDWESVILVQSPDKDYIISDCDTDPREAYINNIFYPGQFSLVDIARALNIYRRSNFLTDTNLSLHTLKERVYMAVESEIQTEAMEYELMDEDYLEIVNRCWSKFYSCILQYHLSGCRPVGLLLLPNVYGVIVLKKSSFSLLRPMEALEHLMLCNEKSHIARFKNTPILSQDDVICQDLIALMSSLVTLEDWLSDDLKCSFQKDLHQLKGPDYIIENLSKLIWETNDQFSDFDFLTELYRRLENVKDISSAMAMLLEALTYDLGQPDNLQLHESCSKNSYKSTNLKHLFGSQLGISTISHSITQIASLKFSICRNLLILQQIVISRPEIFDTQSLHAIKSSLAPRAVVLLQAYYIIVWISESNASVIPSRTLLGLSAQRLSLLKFCKSRSCIVELSQRSYTLLELFTKYAARQHIHNLIDDNNFDTSSFAVWHFGMLSLITFVAQLIWPISGNFIFPEWLLSSGQFLLVQEYVRLLSTWCEWNSASRQFILAVSLLEIGEPQKACDHFLKASNGIIVDTYLSSLLLPFNMPSECNAIVYYYLKVIDIFEQHSAYDCIIELAMTAITIAEKEDKNLPTLHSIVFAQHLQLQHHVEAYNCLNTNPDSARRVDCLRQLVVTLFNRKKLTDLVLFPYADMYQELETIMEARARSVDLMENNYYDFLYSFHINKGNMRKAASIMYEQAMRLSQEPHCLFTITKQTNCLLNCINTLHLVSEKYRWIVRPVFEQCNFEKEYSPRKKRTVEGIEIESHNVTKRLEVLELQDIKKEYILAQAKFKLSKFNSDIHVTASTCASEVISIMCSVGLYTPALKVGEHFQLSKASILESLASQCIRLSKNDDLNVWNWLSQNDINDLNLSSSNATAIIWKLLEQFTLSCEANGESELHKRVSRKLFHCGFFLPTWLFLSYAKRNAPELLRLMIQMGRLEEAAYFSIEFIRAILGKGGEYFGLETSLLAVSPCVYFPFNAVEILLLELEYASQSDQSYLKIYELLRNEFINYVHTAERVSSDMIKLNK